MFKLTLPILFLAIVFLVGCTVPVPPMASSTDSGNVVTQEIDFADFDRLDVGNGFQVDIIQGDTFNVVIRISENLVERLQVAKEGNTLKIGLEPSLTFNLETVTLEADITIPALMGLKQGGGSHVNLKDFKSALTLDADLSGGSHLKGDVEAGDAAFELDGGSHVTLSGSAGDITVDAGGGSHAKLAKLAVVNANVTASGGSHVTVNPSGTLDAASKGGSHVRYVGSPTLGTIDDDTSSSIKQE